MRNYREQMSGRITKNEWKAHQDRLMREKKHWACSSNSCRPGGRGADRRKKPAQDQCCQQRNFCCGSSAPAPGPLAGTPPRSGAAGVKRLGSHASPYLSCRLGRWRQVSLSFHPIRGCRQRGRRAKSLDRTARKRSNNSLREMNAVRRFSCFGLLS